jgi:hypothetical protein
MKKELSVGEKLLYPVCCLFGVLTVTLKLAGVIDWSWIAVLAPFWVLPLVIFSLIAICFLFIGLFLLGGIVFSFFADYFNRKKTNKMLEEKFKWPKQ